MSSRGSTDEQEFGFSGKGNTGDNVLSNRTAGYMFLALAGMLVVALMYMTIFVAVPLTRTPKFTEQLFLQATLDLKQERLSKNADWLNFLVALEYSAAGSRTVNIQIASASIGGLFLVVVGMLLFTLGVLHPFGFEASAEKYSVKWIDGTPGAFCALLGTAVLIAGVMKSPMTIEEMSFAQERVTERSEDPPAVNVGMSDVPEGIGADYLTSGDERDG